LTRKLPQWHALGNQICKLALPQNGILLWQGLRSFDFTGLFWTEELCAAALEQA
jgi:hypothetical protein